jgi:hypothetical protein
MSAAMAEADRSWNSDYRPRSNASVEIVDDDGHLLTCRKCQRQEMCNNEGVFGNRDSNITRMGFHCGAKVRRTSVDRRMISDAKVYSNLRRVG